MPGEGGGGEEGGFVYMGCSVIVRNWLFRLCSSEAKVRSRLALSGRVMSACLLQTDSPTLRRRPCWSRTVSDSRWRCAFSSTKTTTPAWTEIAGFLMI
jgi:hypothetical protein